METLQNFDFLFAAYAILWVIVFGYFFFLTRQLGDLRREVHALREERTGGDGDQEAKAGS